VGSGVTQSVQCLTTDWTTGVRSLAEIKDFSSGLCAQTGSKARPSSYPMCTGGPFQGVERGRSVTLTTHPIKCRGQERIVAIATLPLYACMAVVAQRPAVCENMFITVCSIVCGLK
jgi:hypothetical protein